MLKLDIGAGKLREEGWTTLDCAAISNPDILSDLEEALPLEDNSVEAMRAFHVLEHITRLIPLMNECHRVIQPFGYFQIRVPIWPSIAAVIDPTHVRQFAMGTFHYWEAGHALHEDFGTLYGILPWKVLQQPTRHSDGENMEVFIVLQPVKNNA